MVNELIDDKEKKARQVLRRIFKGTDATTMSRQEVVDKVGERYLQNYSGPMFKYGLLKYDRDEGQGRKILTIRLTAKGKEVIANQSTTGVTTTLDPLTNLNALGEFIERFNSRNKYWELKLTPKEEVASQR